MSDSKCWDLPEREHSSPVTAQFSMGPVTKFQQMKVNELEASPFVDNSSLANVL